MEDVVFDCFEQIANVPDENLAERKKPSEGPHRFIVKRASYFEDSSKLSLLLEAKDGGSLFKKLYFGDPQKANVNKTWMRCLIDEKPTGRLVDFNWESLEGRHLDATVGVFTPQDRDTEIWYAEKPVRCDQPKAKATVDQKAKAAMSKEMESEIPF